MPHMHFWPSAVKIKPILKWLAPTFDMQSACSCHGQLSTGQPINIPASHAWTLVTN